MQQINLYTIHLARVDSIQVLSVKPGDLILVNGDNTHGNIGILKSILPDEVTVVMLDATVNMALADEAEMNKLGWYRHARPT